MLPQEIIRRKGRAQALEAAEIQAFVRGIVDRSWTEGQVAAFAMAVCLRGMNRDECVALTQAMTDSGDRLDWSRARLNGPLLDKHSTGGVGDKVSLLLGPMVAACGGYVPMISGRGLGITGGTLYQKRFCSHMDLRTGGVIQFSATGIVLAVLALLLETDRGRLVSRRMVLPDAIARSRIMLEHSGINWAAMGFRGAAMNDLVEYLLRMIQSMVIAPSDPPRSPAALRDYLRQWIAPVLRDASNRAEPEIS